nr:ribonuclease H-like domain-containing protein [Tanacetum cinerariifolium]
MSYLSDFKEFDGGYVTFGGGAKRGKITGKGNLKTESSTKRRQGYVDSGCSRHITRNMSYLSDFKEFDGGYVTFWGGAKRGKITGKGNLKTGKLDFEDVYFVKEL